MTEWSNREGLELLDRLLSALREGEKRIDASGAIPGNPVDLRGLRFPNVTQCTDLGLSTVVAKRISGQQVFNATALNNVDLSESMLDFSVWNESRFENVCFHNARLQNVRFFGCTFQNCSFRSTDLRHASFSVGRCGVETELINTTFEKANFSGASSHNPVLRRVRFVNCKFEDFVFESPLCDGVEFVGRYNELQFHGMPREPERNKLRIDLSRADIKWFDANEGLDLTTLTLPSDGSCMVLTDRARSAEIIGGALAAEESEAARRLGVMLVKIFSDRSISPESPRQTTFLLSRRVIADLAEDSRKEVIDGLFSQIRSIAAENGFLASGTPTHPSPM